MFFLGEIYTNIPFRVRLGAPDETGGQSALQGMHQRLAPPGPSSSPATDAERHLLSHHEHKGTFPWSCAKRGEPRLRLWTTARSCVPGTAMPT